MSVMISVISDCIYGSAPSPSQPTQDLLFVEEDVPVRPSKPSRQVNKKRRNSTPGYRGLKCDLPDSFLRVRFYALCFDHVYTSVSLLIGKVAGILLQMKSWH